MSTATRELRRFLTIAGRRLADGQSSPEMFSSAVDAAWHEMLGTPQYMTLCRDTAGQPIGHVAMKGYGPIAWVASYEAEYGPLPQIWFTDTEGHVDQEAISQYRNTGIVVAEWNCGPAGGDGDGDEDLAPERQATARS